MIKENPGVSALENYEVSIVRGGACPCNAGMIRAVVKLPGDVSPAMPLMSKLIQGCAYNQKNNIVGFRIKGMGVVVEAHRITINNASDKATADTVICWIRNIITTNDAKAVSTT